MTTSLYYLPSSALTAMFCDVGVTCSPGMKWVCELQSLYRVCGQFAFLSLSVLNQSSRVTVHGSWWYVCPQSKRLSTYSLEGT